MREQTRKFKARLLERDSQLSIKDRDMVRRNHIVFLAMTFTFMITVLSILAFMGQGKADINSVKIILFQIVFTGLYVYLTFPAGLFIISVI